MTVSLKPVAQRTAERVAREAVERRERRRALRDEAERTRVPERLKPTRATAARLQPDPIETLHQRGSLSDRQRDAALEIRIAFAEVAAGAMMRSPRYDGTRGAGFVGTSNGVELAMAGAIGRRKRYRRWAEALGARLPDALAVTIDVVVDGRSLRQVDGERHWRNGRASDLLIEALQAYAQLAGWERSAAVVAG
jgi:hypothetical protein